MVGFNGFVWFGWGVVVVIVNSVVLILYLYLKYLVACRLLLLLMPV